MYRGYQYIIGPLLAMGRGLETTKLDPLEVYLNQRPPIYVRIIYVAQLGLIN